MAIKISKKTIQKMIKEELDEIGGDSETGRFRPADGRDQTSSLASIGGKEKADVTKAKEKSAKMAGRDTVDKTIDSNQELAQYLVGEMERIVAQNPKLDPKMSINMILQNLNK